jgi:hypothetical protein
VLAFALGISFIRTVNATNPYDVTSTQTSTTPVSGGNASVTQADTGTSVSVTGLTGVTGSATITTSTLTGPDPGTPLLQGPLVLYFDIHLSLSGGQTVPPGAVAHVCFDQPGVTAGMALKFYSGGGWISATNVTVNGTQICGDVPAADLTGTNFAAVLATLVITSVTTVVSTQVVTSVTTVVTTQFVTSVSVVTQQTVSVLTLPGPTQVTPPGAVSDLEFYGAIAAALLISLLAVFLARSRM